EKFDAIVVGGGISGLIATQILSQAGYRVLLAEKEANLGGTNGSFRNARGDTFDFGYHTIDYNRSPFTTRYFARMLKGKFHLLSLRRGIA
ncbi:FAD-dependent oxidoreductase, partial [Acinetobacter baumannii]